MLKGSKTMAQENRLKLSGDRFAVVYHLSGSEAEASAKAADICLEQTVELPDELVKDRSIREEIVGQVVSLRQLQPDLFEAVITFAAETSGFELTQLLNVIFGNISLQPGIRVERLQLSPSFLGAFRGPRFGREGLRSWLKVPHRPLLCTALKPMGMSASELAELAHRLALGGIDIIKDDHGLANQPFCPFEERVERCAEAVARANRATGLDCIYMPNVTAPVDEVLERALFAKAVGARGLLISPGLTGFDTMRRLADDDRVVLPLMSHPAFQGSLVTISHAGISHFALFGQMARLAGADASIFPNYGGRFPFKREDCCSLAQGTGCEMGPIKPIFPTPAGGMSLERVPELGMVYGREVIFLIGAGLIKHSPNLVENCRYFKQLVEQI
jgi:ribulose-bisphosphate carboxylase large chain